MGGAVYAGTKASLSQYFMSFHFQDTYEYVYIPSDDSGIELPNGELMTPVEEQSLSLTPDVSPGTPPGSATKKRVSSGFTISSKFIVLCLLTFLFSFG